MPVYTSHLSAWRKTRRNGSLQGLTPKKRGAKPAESNPLSAKVRQLEAKVARPRLDVTERFDSQSLDKERGLP